MRDEAREPVKIAKAWPGSAVAQAPGVRGPAPLATGGPGRPQWLPGRPADGAQPTGVIRAVSSLTLCSSGPWTPVGRTARIWEEVRCQKPRSTSILPWMGQRQAGQEGRAASAVGSVSMHRLQ